jgi:hypothetical protein
MFEKLSIQEVNPQVIQPQGQEDGLAPALFDLIRKDTKQRGQARLPDPELNELEQF